MFDWRPAWAYLCSRYFPPLYRRWRFASHRTLSWAALPGVRNLEPELLILPELLTGPGRFLDVGANNGAYLHTALSRKAPGDVVGVEPIPRLCRVLERVFPGILARNLALTDSEGPRTLKIPDIGGRKYDTRATLNVDYQEEGETGNTLLTIEASTLDTFWKELGDPPLAGIKIDTEGHEASVLAGARATVARHRPLLMVEIEQRHHAEDISVIVDSVRSLGYGVHHFDRAARAVVPLAAPPSSLQRGREGRVDYVNNFIFLPDGIERFREAVARVNRLLAGSP